MGDHHTRIFLANITRVGNVTLVTEHGSAQHIRVLIGIGKYSAIYRISISLFLYVFRAGKFNWVLRDLRVLFVGL
jgi:hypothetical protein